MFKRKNMRQSKVIITFKHGEREMPPEIIYIQPGQHFEQCIGTDKLWEGNTLLKAYNWRAGYTVEYTYYYAPKNSAANFQEAIDFMQGEKK